MLILNFRIKRTWLKRLLQIIVFVLVWLFLSNFSTKHHPSDIFDYRSEFFADKGGYYVYFPATFIYGYQANNFPKGIDIKVGLGFTLDTISNKVFTKYSSGVAMLTTPFFLTTHIYQKATGQPATGFTEPYFKTANYAAVFYFLIGIIFLFSYLKNFYRASSVIIALLVMFCTTHLFYYALIETLMSHVYSFTLFSILLWTMNKYINDARPKYIILLGLLIGFIILIRPINVLFLFPAFFLNIRSWVDVKERFKLFFQARTILIVAVIVILVFIPQLAYYRYLSGNFFIYTYGKEGFTSLLSPKILEVLFSTRNGLLLYTPVFVFFIISSLIMVFNKKINGYISLFSFLLMVYISASWWIWTWGCSLSMRPMVDILPLLVLPFVAFIDLIYQKRKFFLITIFSALFMFLGYMNMQFSNVYNHCFEGEVWQWNEYNKIMRKAHVFPFTTEAYRNVFDKEIRIAMKIKTSEGAYLSLTPNNNIIATHTENSNAKNNVFYLINIVNGNISLKSHTMRYITSDQNNNGVCIANRDEIGGWEVFSVYPLKDDLFVLKNSVGKYLKFDSSHMNYLTGAASDPASAQQFKFEYIKVGSKN